MAGSLPGIGLLHLRQLGAFGMICRLPGNILNLHAVNIFTFATSKSWFLNIRDVCLQYKLPNPLELLKAPLPKEKYKNLIKKHVVDYWEQELRSEQSEASVRDPLTYFKPEFMSLQRPQVAPPAHPPAKISASSS